MLDECAKAILSWVPPNRLSEGRRCVTHVQSVAVSYTYSSLADAVDTRIACPHLNCTTEASSRKPQRKLRAPIVLPHQHLEPEPIAQTPRHRYPTAADGKVVALSLPSHAGLP